MISIMAFERAADCGDLLPDVMYAMAYLLQGKWRIKRGVGMAGLDMHAVPHLLPLETVVIDLHHM